MLGIVLQWQIPLFDTAVWQIFKLHGKKKQQKQQEDLSPHLQSFLRLFTDHSLCVFCCCFVLKEFQHNRIPPKLNLSTFGLFSNIFVSEYIKECYLCSEAPSVKSGQLQPLKSTSVSSPALQNPSKVSPSSCLWAALIARLFSVISASFRAFYGYKSQLLTSPASSCWRWGPQKENMPEWQAGDMDHKGYERKWREQRHYCRPPQHLFPSHFS